MAKAKDVDLNADRFPTLTRTLQRIMGETEAGDVTIERLEVHLHASGDATYRYWTPRADEPEGGYLYPE